MKELEKQDKILLATIQMQIAAELIQDSAVITGLSKSGLINSDKLDQALAFITQIDVNVDIPKIFREFKEQGVQPTKELIQKELMSRTTWPFPNKGFGRLTTEDFNTTDPEIPSGRFMH